MIDKQTYSASSVDNPAGEAVEVTPADTDLAKYTRALYIGGTGDVAVIMAHENVADGTTVVTFKGVLAGSILPIRVSQVRAATTATDIVALL